MYLMIVSHVVGVPVYPSSILAVDQGHADHHSSLPIYRRANMVSKKRVENERRLQICVGEIGGQLGGSHSVGEWYSRRSFRNAYMSGKYTEIALRTHGDGLDEEREYLYLEIPKEF